MVVAVLVALKQVLMVALHSPYGGASIGDCGDGGNLLVLHF
jgi:hypothetical protein